MLPRATVAVGGKRIRLWAPSVNFTVCEVLVGFALGDKAAASTRFGSRAVGPGMQEWHRLGLGPAQPLAMECAGFSFGSHLNRAVLGAPRVPRVWGVSEVEAEAGARQGWQSGEI